MVFDLRGGRRWRASAGKLPPALRHGRIVKYGARPWSAMYFDYFIVLVFVAAGGLYHLARRPAGNAEAPAADAPARSRFSGAVVTIVFLAALSLLFPWALVLHDCLFDRGPAQSLGIGAFALAAGAVFVAILSLGAWHARKSD